ncbi:ELAV-like protein 2 [Paramacrobiotus metropolitanus]|uniref:ELAV-like protein 2 n=1 Tax=Paramacrobiotus metropolitanus TaxID=2943436 RepID=UPI002445C1F6|nr:ELAV-like protein 2 [Paramacrobiotus metropolitanus]
MATRKSFLPRDISGNASQCHTAEIDRCRVIVNYLPVTVKEPFVEQIFGTRKILGQHGELLECRVIRRRVHGDRISRGYAFLTYSHEDAAARAVKLLNGFILLNSGSPEDVDAAGDRKVKQLKVSFCRPSDAEHQNTNLFITGVPCEWELEDLREHFGRSGGAILTNKLAPRNCICKGAVVNGNPTVPCETTNWAFVRFSRHADAVAAQRRWHMQQPQPGRGRPLNVRILDDDRAGLRYLQLQ